MSIHRLDASHEGAPNMQSAANPSSSAPRSRGLVAAFALLLAALLSTGCPSQEGGAGSNEAANAASPTSPSAGSNEADLQEKEELMSLAAIDAFIAEQNIDTSGSSWKTSLPKPPMASFGEDETIYWLLKTNVGDIKIELLPQVAPMHVTSTIYLTKLGFYDDVIFHRVIDGFMAQGGDPLGRGTGGPGYQYDGEFDSSVRHDKPGLLSMANAGPGTDGSQFFLTFVPTPHLDGKHTIFGQVVEGMDTVRALEARGSRSGRTTEPLKIESATIVVE
jgi:cyclophilin family peptidyl-prolyl cis-trans isomerase